MVDDLKKSLSKDFTIGSRKTAQLVLKFDGQLALETAGVGQARNALVRQQSAHKGPIFTFVH